MKNTGVIRRIDDLGRVVIPKEIRRTLGIREGDPLEVYIQNDMVCYKKFNAEGELTELLDKAYLLLEEKDNLSEDEIELRKIIRKCTIK
jgi:AbrB family transcriptional regulator (stage V sporulation protein T)